MTPFSCGKQTIVGLVLFEVQFVRASLQPCTHYFHALWSQNTTSTSSHNEYRIQALSDYVYICRGLGLHSNSLTRRLQSKNEKKKEMHKYSNNYHKKIQDKSDRRCSVSVQNTTPARQCTKEINMKENIHIINYGFVKFKRIQVFSIFRQVLRVQTALV